MDGKEALVGCGGCFCHWVPLAHESEKGVPVVSKNGAVPTSWSTAKKFRDTSKGSEDVTTSANGCGMSLSLARKGRRRECVSDNVDARPWEQRSQETHSFGRSAFSQECASRRCECQRRPAFPGKGERAAQGQGQAAPWLWGHTPALGSGAVPLPRARAQCAPPTRAIFVTCPSPSCTCLPLPQICSTAESCRGRSVSGS